MDDKKDVVMSEDVTKAEDVKMSEPGRPATDYGLPDDEIVAEIPVFLTEKIAKNLHLLQYPLKAGSIGPGELRPSTARIKPIHGQIEMDIPLDVTSPMYNRERGQELGIGLSDSGRLLDIQTIVSVDIPKSSTYLAGVLKNRELHLTPIEKITQLRPSLKYLDKVAEKERAASKLDYDDEDTKEDKQVQTVQVSVRSAQAEEALRQQQNSIASIQKRLEEEPWSSLTYYDIGSDGSAAVSSQLVAANTEDLICKTDPSEYLTTIIGNTCPDVN